MTTLRSPVLVTGGTGFTGSHLVADLLGDGVEVRVLTRFADRALDRLPGSVRVVEGDVTDRARVREAVDRCGVIFHLATSFREADVTREGHRKVHVEGTRKLLRSALDAGVDRFVHCSTVGVHGDIPDPPADEAYRFSPGDAYQATKLEAERMALEFHRDRGLPVAVARPTPIYGPGDNRLLKLFRLIERGWFVILGDGEVFYHMVHVEDLVRGMRLLAEHPGAVGEPFILGGEEYRTLNELTEIVARLLGVSPPRLHLPARPFQLLGSACEAVCRPLGIAPPLYRRRVDFFTKSRAFSIDKARTTLGYAPRISLEDGLRATLDWHREHGHLRGGAR